MPTHKSKKSNSTKKQNQVESISNSAAINADNISNSVVIQGDKNVIFNFVQDSSSPQNTSFTQFKSMQDIKMIVQNLPIPKNLSGTDIIRVKFHSLKWGFHFEMNVPIDMRCGTLASILFEGFQLQEHVKVMGEKISILWQIEISNNKLCDGHETLREAGVKEGDTIHLRGTVFEKIVDYLEDKNGEILGEHISKREIENWLM